MKTYKKILTGLFVSVVLLGLVLSVFSFILSKPAYALTQDQIKSQGQDWCKKNFPRANQTDCINGYVTGYNGKDPNSACGKLNGENKTWCLSAAGAGHTASQKAGDLPPTASTGQTISACQGYQTAEEQKGCQAGVEGATAGKSKSDSCNGKGFSGKALTACQTTYDIYVVPLPQNNDPARNAPQEAVKACKDYSPSGSKNNNTFYRACLQGYADGAAGKTQAEACGDSKYADGPSKNACEEGWTAGNDGTDPSNACEAENNTGFEWLICGVLRGIDGFVNDVRGTIESQLNFDVGQNLNAHVKQAWGIFRVLSTIIMVIILLVMILAQAAGSGLFEAYTIRKILPRVVIAIIAIQLSWVMFKYVVVIANDAGKGIGDLLALPFGGTDALSLDKLLGNLGPTATGVTVVSGTLLTGIALIINPFGAVMMAFLVFVAIIAALATLLFREALIIGAIIFAPIALALWILPGTQKYWKMWWENFSKALFLFPMIIAMITVGQIFAWIVGAHGGTPGALDVFAIILGFFGPYFLLPRAFSWGGSALKMAANGIERGVSPIRKAGQEEIKGMKERHQGSLASQYDPDKNRQSRLKGAFYRAASGNLIPTERGRRLTIQKGEEWKGERDKEAQAMMARQYQKGLDKGYYYTDPDTGEKKFIEPGLKAAKQGLVDMVGYDGDDPNKKRAAKMAIEELLRTQSFWEMQNSPINAPGKYQGLRIHDTDIWQNRLENNPDAWKSVAGKRPDAIPTVTGETYGGNDMEVMRTLAHYAPEEYKESARGDSETDEQYKARTLQEWMGEKGQKYRERNKGYLDKRLNEVKGRQARLGPGARLDDADRLTKALRQGYADAQSSPGYAEGWWDEIIDQMKVGNTAASQDMLKQFIEIAGTGQAGLGVLNHLAAGPLREKVNKALGGSNQTDILGKLIEAAKTSDIEATSTILGDVAKMPATARQRIAEVQRTSTVGPITTAAGQTTGGPGPGSDTPAAPSRTAAGTPAAPQVSSVAPAAAATSETTTPQGEIVLNIDHNALEQTVARGVREGFRTSPEAQKFQPGQVVHPQTREPFRASSQTESGILLPEERRTRSPQEPPAE